ncbi:MAG: phosphoglucosamine mutase [Flavobacteriales bacterium]
MTLIKSISGIRGTIGGHEGDALTPIDIVRYTSAYCHIIQREKGNAAITIVVGRDARISGAMVSALMAQTLSAMGASVINLGLSTTPSVEVAVKDLNADGGIIITASHNPVQWNALKLLNSKGEFISAELGQELLAIADSGKVNYAEVFQLGKIEERDFLQRDIELILALPMVDREAIANAGFRVGVDAVNSTGSIYVPALLKALGVQDIEIIHGDTSGNFAHNPEPLPEHLKDLGHLVTSKKCTLGIAVDPDVDRLALVCEDGSAFGEEYTLVAVADYVLSVRKGNTVSNLSSSRALRDVTLQHGGQYTAAAVGEVNVVKKMKETQAVIGGEVNCGVIFPDSHYGRDALAGIALFLSHLAQKKMSMTALRNHYPKYEIVKEKLELDPAVAIDEMLERVIAQFPEAEVNTLDGLKLDFAEGWVHLRKSNTEPIVRVIAEHRTREEAQALASSVMQTVKKILAG